MKEVLDKYGLLKFIVATFIALGVLFILTVGLSYLLAYLFTPVMIYFGFQVLTWDIMLKFTIGMCILSYLLRPAPRKNK